MHLLPPFCIWGLPLHPTTADVDYAWPQSSFGNSRPPPNPTPSLIIRSPAPPAAYTLHFLPRLALPCRVSHLLHRLLLLSPVAASPSNHLRLIRVCAPAPPGSRAVFCRNCWPKNRLLIWRRGRTRSLVRAVEAVTSVSQQPLPPSIPSIPGDGRTHRPAFPCGWMPKVVEED